MYYAEACNEFEGPISASFCRGNTDPLKEMSQRWRAVGNTVFDLTDLKFDIRPPAPKTNALPIDQRPVIREFILFN